jgi:uncharacterized protein (DUF1501 family)
MKRRTFLRGAIGAAAMTPVLLDRVWARPSSPLSLLAQLDSSNDNILILVQLFGGNDGLNTVVPADQDEYYTIRPNIAIAKNLLWNNFPGIYLHPGLAAGSQGGIAHMLELGTLAIIHRVGYENPNLSHFRSTDIWLSGINDSNPNDRLDTGWLGRFLEKQYPNFPAQLPSDPLAINFGGFSLALTSEKGRMGIEVDNPDLQAGGLSASGDTLDDLAAGTRYAIEYAFVQDVANRSNTYAQRVKDAYTTGRSMLKGNYGIDGFAQQMAAVAALIAGGLGTRVYVVGMGGFDTHVNQVSGSYSHGDDTSTGTHHNLLAQLADGIAQFQYDLGVMGQAVANRLLGFTISEFGRRPHDNFSSGTDHGAASVQFVFGSQVNGGIYGQQPDLTQLDANGDVSFQVDYRTVYTTLLSDWYGMTLDDARAVMNDTKLEPFPGLIKQSGVAPHGASSPSSLSVYPNPFATGATVSFDLPVSVYVQIEMVSMNGTPVATIVDRTLAAGSYSIPFSEEIEPGAYLLSMRTNSGRLTTLVNVVR